LSKTLPDFVVIYDIGVYDFDGFGILARNPKLTGSFTFCKDYIIGIINPSNPSSIVWGIWDTIPGMADGRYRVPCGIDKWNKELWLTEKSHSSMRDAILFMGELFNILGDIETAVKSGKTEDFHSPDKTHEFWKYYIRGLATFARSAGREIVRKVSLNKEPKRLLDIGGGHGMYSVAFCRKYASMQAVVLDLPGAVEQGKNIVREKGFEDRVRFRQGDLKVTEWGKGYDLVLLFNIIHTVFPEEAPRILARAHQSLNPGGTVVILDSEHTGNEKDLSATSGFNELLFFIINGTCVYPEKDIRKWMTDAGFINLKKKKLLIMPMTLFITGRKPS